MGVDRSAHYRTACMGDSVCLVSPWNRVCLPFCAKQNQWDVGEGHFSSITILRPNCYRWCAAENPKQDQIGRVVATIVHNRRISFASAARLQCWIVTSFDARPEKGTNVRLLDTLFVLSSSIALEG